MKHLTINEQIIVEDIIKKVFEIMSPDETLSENETIYSDGGNFLHSMDEYDIEILKSAINKF